MILYTGVVIYYNIIADQISTEEFSMYTGPMLTGIGGIFGILGIVTMYYLGKFHDYTKEIIRYSSEYQFEKMKLETLIERKKSDKTEKISALLDVPLEENFQWVSDIPNHVIKTALWISLYYGWAIYYLLSNMNEPTINNFYITVVSTISGIGIFIVVWLEYEHLLSDGLEILNKEARLLSSLKHQVFVHKSSN